MKSKILFLALSALLFAIYASAEAQQPQKLLRIGYLSGANSARDSIRLEPFRLALHELGYIEGKNIAIEYRYGEGKNDRVPELAAELVHLKVDIILVSTGRLTQAAKIATNTIPIVMIGLPADPVELGFVASLARPGGNITGITTLSRELGGKRLELLKEAIPKAARIAVLYEPATSAAVLERGSTSRGARAGIDYSLLGNTSCGRYREGIRSNRQRTAGWNLRDLGTPNGF
jgi:putative tryptophan/tyrosine transport system substrate-binding protein